MSDEKKKDKHPGGRPSKFDSIDLEQVEKLAVLGWTDEQMAGFFKVTPQTWHNWKKAHPKFFDALKNWKDQADKRIERSLYERAMGYSHPDTKFATHEGVITDQKEYIKHYAPDTTACIFWLKNRNTKEWRDKRELDMNANINTRELSDKELQDRASKLLELARKQEV